jgi:general secretion pathway protein G
MTRTRASIRAHSTELVSAGYLRKVPDDPFTLSASTRQTIPGEPNPNNPNAPPGVYYVKSGSDATAFDGTKYSDWQKPIASRSS